MRFFIPERLICLPLIVLYFLLPACSNTGKRTSDLKVIQPVHNRVAIEIILDEELFKDSLMTVLKDSPLELFEWKNHIVLFGNASDTLGIEEIVSDSDFTVKIKRYNKPIYIFDKVNHCPDSSTQKPWKNYLLTANLVKDVVLQQEYVNYHEKQFEEWPEVAQGFCNAGFQQLLVYRSDRQLLLVISIPEDKTLDELNPKTVENNPRMDEWNNIMGKYQEGIEGTNPDETWVFLEPIEFN